MPTAPRTSSRASTTARRTTRQKDAVALLREDHKRVNALFEEFEKARSDRRKKEIVAAICQELTVHAALEEEIFYPALRAAMKDGDLLDEAQVEHDEMRRLIGELREMSPEDEAYDETFMALMREVIHHVADEETTLLPEAERVLADQLSELGAQMTKRRMELAAPRAGEIATNTVRAMPTTTLLMAAGGMLAGGYLLKRAFGERRA